MRAENLRRLKTLTSPRLALGVAAIVLGALFLGRELDWLDFDTVAVVWPLLPMIYGAVRLLAGSTLWGIYWMGLGGLLLVYNLSGRPVDVGDVLVPVALLSFGVHLLSRAAEDRARGVRSRASSDRARAAGEPTAEGGAEPWSAPGVAFGSGPAADAPDIADTGEGHAIHAFAFLSGVERRGRAQGFRGGDAVAVMGGCDLDLRGSQLAPGGATLDVLAFWGAVTILVPRDWDVDCQVVGVLGGVEDHSGSPAADSPGPRPAGAAPRSTLVVRGAAIMGGVEIKHEPDRS